MKPYILASGCATALLVGATLLGSAPTVAAEPALSATPASTPADETSRLNAFFEQVFQRNLARSPIRESRLGIRTHQDQWDDVSDRRQIEDAALTRGALRRLHQFDRSKLTPDAQLSYRLFELSCEEKLKAFRWRRNDYLITQMGGLHRTVATTLLNSHSINERADADAYIARLVGVKALMGQLVTELKRQEEAGVLPPRFVYALTIEESRNLIAGRPFDNSAQDSPILADFASKLVKTDWPRADRDAFIVKARTALLRDFGPGYRQLISHLEGAQKNATDDDGVWKLPHGEAYYRYALESYTTLPVTPAEIHALGISEVARIQDEMRAVMKAVGFAGTLQQFFEHLRTDPQFYYADSVAGRSQYVADAKALLDEVKARQSEVLGLVPKIDVEVRPVEGWREKAAAKAFYSGPPPDGSLPGIFYINLYDMGAAPKYQLAVELYHEAIPGHHVETVVAYELPALPKFRKFAGIAAFSEGWGLYSERLAKEMGLYRDPYAEFGRLSLALMRATRLVVDTGMHEMKWTRKQAIDYLDQNMPSSHYDNQREIERYIVLPGQATSYMVGMMKIVELRERARTALGARFDLRAFHDVVLGKGPLPLPFLEENVNAWIQAQEKAGS
jgi:uncharacterized protein (DUF885 family)